MEDNRTPSQVLNDSFNELEKEVRYWKARACNAEFDVQRFSDCWLELNKLAQNWAQKNKKEKK